MDGKKDIMNLHVRYAAGFQVIGWLAFHAVCVESYISLPLFALVFSLIGVNELESMEGGNVYMISDMWMILCAMQCKLVMQFA